MKGINLTEADWKEWLPKIVKINSFKNPKTMQYMSMNFQVVSLSPPLVDNAASNTYISAKLAK